jgi:hypothetical protein
VATQAAFRHLGLAVPKKSPTGGPTQGSLF